LTSTFAGRIIIQPKNFNARFMQNIQHIGLMEKFKVIGDDAVISDIKKQKTVGILCKISNTLD
jgi:hypothetical protein